MTNSQEHDGEGVEKIEPNDFTPEGAKALVAASSDMLDDWYAARGITTYRRELRNERDALRAALEKLTRERDEAKRIVAKCCNALPNGAYCSEGASLEFMAHVPDEVLLVTSKQVARISALEAENARLREAISRVLNPAPGVRKPEPWVYGILQVALSSTVERDDG